MGIGATVALIKALAPKTDPAEIEQIEEDVSDLKTAIQGIDGSLFPFSNIEWEQGTINAGTGAPSSSSSAIRTKGRIGTESTEIKTKNGYVMTVYGYNENGEYLGVWNNGQSKFQKSGVSWYTSANTATMANGKRYTFQIAMKLDAGGSVSPTDKTNCEIKSSTLKGFDNRIGTLEDVMTPVYDGSVCKWIGGTFDGTNGAVLSSQTAIRVTDYLPEGVEKIETYSPFVFYVFAYNKTTGEYVGCWNRSSKAYAESISAWYDSLDFSELNPKNNYFKVAVKKSTGDTFTIAEAVQNISISANSIKKNEKILYDAVEDWTEKKQSDDVVAIQTTSIYPTKSGYKKPLTLLHFSDPHNDMDNYPAIMNFFKRNKIDDMICTGDIVGTKYNADQVSVYFSVFTSPYALLVPGNHEYYTNDSGSSVMTQATAYGYYIAPTVENWGAEYTENKTYWYKDYLEEGIRLIGLDCMLNSSDMTAQVTWLEGVLSDAKTNSLAVVIAAHCPPRTTGTKIDSSFTSVQAIPLDSDDNYSIDQNGAGILAAVDSFMSGGGEFVCYLMGHWHMDYLMYPSNYPNQTIVVVGTAGSTDGPNGILTGGIRRDKGTIYQHLFNVVSIDRTDKLFKIVRIGADRDMYMRSRKTMCFDYNTRTVVYSD